MQMMKEAHQDEGLAIVAVNLDPRRPDADRFLDKLRPTFDIRFDPDGETAQRFQLHGMPTSLIIDRKGVVRFTHIGFRPVDRALYEDQLRQVLAEK
jgi:cytochrome c biogenesis protein CcmG/thiol:disulfide interchange protein DsbE